MQCKASGEDATRGAQCSATTLNRAGTPTTPIGASAATASAVHAHPHPLVFGVLPVIDNCSASNFSVKQRKKNPTQLHRSIYIRVTTAAAAHPVAGA